MAVKHPSVEDLACIAPAYHLSLTHQDLESFRAFMTSTLLSYARLDQLTEPTLPVQYPRRPGYRPQPQDNPLGAWYWRCEITGAPSGLLTGKTIAIKDNVCKVEFYMRQTGRQVDRKVVVVPYADERAKEVALRLGLEVCTDVAECK